MALHDIFETKQLKAYFLAESDSFEKHPDVYWLKAEASVIAVGHKNPQRKTTKAKAMTKDKLTLIDGIGPKIAGLLNKNGITTFVDLAETNREMLYKILEDGGRPFAAHKPDSWPNQAKGLLSASPIE